MRLADDVGVVVVVIADVVVDDVVRDRVAGRRTLLLLLLERWAVPSAGEGATLVGDTRRNPLVRVLPEPGFVGARSAGGSGPRWVLQQVRQVARRSRRVDGRDTPPAEAVAASVTQKCFWGNENYGTAERWVAECKRRPDQCHTRCRSVKTSKANNPPAVVLGDKEKEKFKFDLTGVKT